MASKTWLGMVSLWLLLVLSFTLLATASKSATLHPFLLSRDIDLTYRDVPATNSSLLSNATKADITAARKIVKDAIAKASKLNKARLDSPARNRLAALEMYLNVL